MDVIPDHIILKSYWQSAILAFLKVDFFTFLFAVSIQPDLNYIYIEIWP